MNIIEPCTDMDYVRMYETVPRWTVRPATCTPAAAQLIDSLNTGHYGIVNQIGHGFFFDMSVGDVNITDHRRGRPDQREPPS